MKRITEMKSGLRPVGELCGMDYLGRIVFSEELRDSLGWEKGTLVEISTIGSNIYIKKYGCLSCGDTDTVPTEVGRLCKKCIANILRPTELAGGKPE